MPTTNFSESLLPPPPPPSSSISFLSPPAHRTNEQLYCVPSFPPQDFSVETNCCSSIFPYNPFEKKVRRHFWRSQQQQEGGRRGEEEKVERSTYHKKHPKPLYFSSTIKYSDNDHRECFYKNENVQYVIKPRIDFKKPPS